MPTGAGLTGARRMVGLIRKVRGQFPDEAARGLYQETEVESTEVKKRTPVWNSDRPLPFGHAAGTLRSTVHVVGPMRSGTRIYTMIVAGGTTAPYAIYVHEDLEAFHKVGQAKFLESVILESRPHMGARVARRIQINKMG